MIASNLKRPAAARKLRGLFDKREALARRIAQVDHDIARAAIAYADAAGLRAVPRIESLRREVGSSSYPAGSPLTAGSLGRCGSAPVSPTDPAVEAGRVTQRAGAARG